MEANRGAGGGVTPFGVMERARWSDVDAAGIVCYGAYLRFFEVAETEMFRSLGLPVAEAQLRHGLWLVRRRVECDFYRSILLDEQVEVFAFPMAIGRTSLEVGFAARRAGETAIAAESRYVLVAVDRDRLEPVPLPEALRVAATAACMSREEALAAIGAPQEDIERGRQG